MRKAFARAYKDQNLDDHKKMKIAHPMARKSEKTSLHGTCFFSRLTK